MKLFRLIFLLFVFFAFFISCGTKSNDEKITPPQNSKILSGEEMSKVLEDIYLAEGATNRKELIANNPKFYASLYYNYVLTKHNVTRDQFMTSYTYYSSNADEMVKILEVIINDLSQKQGLLQGEKKEGPVKKTIR